MTHTYRGMKPDKTTWLYGSPLRLFGTTYIIPENAVIDPLACFDDILPAYEVDAETVGMFTGFCLKGKQIHEEDIFREECDDEIYYAVVAWIKEWCMFACLVINSDMNEYETYLTLGAEGLDESMFWTFPLCDEEFGERYLAGNIHQHPHLLQTPPPKIKL